MNPSELLLTAKRIAESHVSSGSDLNDAITKIAFEQNLSKSLIERLVEETNKATFLDLLEKKGEQEFPVADYTSIKSKMTPKIEKIASQTLSFEKLDYSNSEFKKMIPENSTSITKIANSNELSEDAVTHLQALIKVANELWVNYNKFMDLENLGQKRYGFKHSEASDLVKIAEQHNDNEILELKSLQTSLEKQAAIFEVIYNGIEKVAGALWGELNPARAALNAGGGPINRAAHFAGALVNASTKGVIGGIGSLAGGTAKLGLKGASVIAPIAIPLAVKGVVKHPNVSLTAATELPRAIGGVRSAIKGHSLVGPGAEAFREALGMEKEAGVEALVPAAKPLFQSALKWGGRALGVSSAVNAITKPVTSMIGPGKIALASEMNKEAGLGDNILGGLQHSLEFLTPATMLGLQYGVPGILGGITAAAAKKLGGGIALTMNKKEFDNSFETIMKNNPELAGNKKQVRGYFDVVSRHAPSLAKDPLVAESIVKNMNAFGGVDYNTVRGLRETESLSNKDKSSDKGLSGLTALFGHS